MSNKVFLFLYVFAVWSSALQAKNRWQIQPDGSIEWKIDGNIPHYDHIEMSGMQMSVVLRYGVGQNGAFSLERSMIWPSLRTIPNDTHGNLMQRFSIDYPSMLIVNGKALSNEKVVSIRLDGCLTVVSNFSVGYEALSANGKNVARLTRTIFPSTEKPMLCELYVLENISDEQLSVIIPPEQTTYYTDPQKGVEGRYAMVSSVQQGAGTYTIGINESISFGTSIQAYKEGQQQLNVDIPKEKQARNDFVKEVWSKLNLKTPDETVNTAFAFAKIRASESIYKTKGGLMHGPGGESYYAAIWANDQAEYANPFFPFLGYKAGNESAFNSFKHFARFMNSEYKPIPSSIIAEGDDIWNGAGDRGDGAMIAYGAARYALAYGDKKEASDLWPLIEWCLEFCKRKLNKDGVVMSDRDELEGRFPAGDANLCTSSLYYDALISAGYLAKELGKPSAVSKKYMDEAKLLKRAINKHFGANVEGFETYRYYEGNDILRSWIAIPLTVGIFERKEGTIDALLSPRLWTKEGLLTQAGTETFWDRSTLYALRGIYEAGEKEKATEFLRKYSEKRLLGEHVPYPIEAWPEGNQRHLSAESALYCRIITEGLFGIRPVGFNKFSLTPQLPIEWNTMALENIEAFSTTPFDIKIERTGNKIRTQIIKAGEPIKTYITKEGEPFIVQLK